MLPTERRERLLQEVRASGFCSVQSLAEYLGVSTPTVRRDVNLLASRGLIEHVHGGARAIPEPDPSARSARRAISTTIGLMVPSFSYYFPGIVRGAQTAAERAGVQLRLSVSSYSVPDNRRHIARLVQLGVAGLIVAPTLRDTDRGTEEFLAWISQLSIPVVLAERRPITSPWRAPMEWVATDHAAGGAMAVAHLMGRGHDGVGLIAQQTSPTTAPIVVGWREELRSRGVDPCEQLCEIGETFGPGRDAMFAALLDRFESRGRRPMAALLHPDPMAVAFVQYCQDLGLRVPEDLAVVAYDDEVAALSHPGITAVQPPKEHVGRLAVETLLGRLAGGRHHPVTQSLVQPRLIVREST